MTHTYDVFDVFVSYARADRHTVEPLAHALGEQGLRVFFDDLEIGDFDRITTAITQRLAGSKAMLAYYSAVYPTRRACQWELTAAYLAARACLQSRGRRLELDRFGAWPEPNPS